MTDLASITFHLRPTHADTIPAYTGRAAQAWFLAALRRLDPALSAVIHDASQLKPYTITGLYPSSEAELLHLSPHQTYYLRLTTLHADLTRLMLNGLLPGWHGGINIHDQPLTVTGIEQASTTYGDLLNRPPQQPPRRLSLTFLSPTVFKRTGDLQMPFPLPEYVFGSLIERWTRFAPAWPLHTALRQWIQASVGIGSHHIHTRRISLERANKGVYIGFVGTVDYLAASSESPFLAQLHALADYAAYAGVGAKTAMGLGQVERTAEVE